MKWAGRQWPVRELCPGAASAVARLASPRREDQLLAVLEVLDLAEVPVEDVIDVAFHTDTPLDVCDLLAGVLEVGSARPWRSTVGLCRTVVTQWSMIRGRLIDKGIPDPLRALPSLTALLDVVEVMILDGMDKDEDRQRFLRDLYRGDRTVTRSVPPPGWEDGADLGGVL